MIGSLQTGVSGLQQFQQQLEVIGDNIANVSTVGYKAARMGFEDVFSQSFTDGASTLQIGTGVGTSEISNQYTQGSIENTGNPTDLAISGNGFFVVRDVSSGAQFVSRAGQFHLDANGYLVTPGGLRVQGYTGAAPYSAGSPVGDLQINSATAIGALNDTTTPAPTLDVFNIDSAGQINARLTDGINGVIGQVVLQNFSNPQELLKQGNNLLAYSSSAGPLAAPLAPKSSGLGNIQAGAIETSNVDLAAEMASLITAQRAFEANAKTITTSDEVLQTLVNLKR